MVLVQNKEDIERVKRTVRVNCIYKHFKGGIYLVDSIAKCSETGKRMVVYKSLKDLRIWVRPYEDFIGIKEVEGGYTFRFSRHSLNN